MPVNDGSNIRITPLRPFELPNMAQEASSLMTAMRRASGGGGDGGLGGEWMFNPVTNKFERVPGGSAKERQANLAGINAIRVMNAWTNKDDSAVQSIQKKLASFDNASVEKKAQIIEDIRRNDIPNLSRTSGIDGKAFIEGPLAELGKRQKEAAQAVAQTGSGDVFWDSLRIGFRNFTDSLADIGDTAAEQMARANARQQYIQDVQSQNAYLQNSARRQAEGADFMDRMSGREVLSAAGEFLGANGPMLAATALSGGIGGAVGGALGLGARGAQIANYVGQGVVGATTGAGMQMTASVDSIMNRTDLSEEQKRQAIEDAQNASYGFGGTLGAIVLPVGQGIRRGVSGALSRRGIGGSELAKTVRNERAGKALPSDYLTWDAAKAGARRADIEAENAIINSPFYRPRRQFQQIGDSMVEGALFGGAGQLGTNVITDRPVGENLGTAVVGGLFGGIGFSPFNRRIPRAVPETHFIVGADIPGYPYTSADFQNDWRAANASADAWAERYPTVPPRPRNYATTPGEYAFVSNPQERARLGEMARMRGFNDVDYALQNYMGDPAEVSPLFSQAQYQSDRAAAAAAMAAARPIPSAQIPANIRPQSNAAQLAEEWNRLYQQLYGPAPAPAPSSLVQRTASYTAATPPNTSVTGVPQNIANAFSYTTPRSLASISQHRVAQTPAQQRLRSTRGNVRPAGGRVSRVAMATPSRVVPSPVTPAATARNVPSFRGFTDAADFDAQRAQIAAANRRPYQSTPIRRAVSPAPSRSVVARPTSPGQITRNIPVRTTETPRSVRSSANEFRPNDILLTANPGKAPDFNAIARAAAARAALHVVVPRETREGAARSNLGAFSDAEWQRVAQQRADTGYHPTPINRVTSLGPTSRPQAQPQAEPQAAQRTAPVTPEQSLRDVAEAAMPEPPKMGKKLQKVYDTVLAEAKLFRRNFNKKTGLHPDAIKNINKAVDRVKTPDELGTLLANLEAVDTSKLSQYRQRHISYAINYTRGKLNPAQEETLNATQTAAQPEAQPTGQPAAAANATALINTATRGGGEPQVTGLEQPVNAGAETTDRANTDNDSGGQTPVADAASADANNIPESAGIDRTAAQERGNDGTEAQQSGEVTEAQRTPEPEASAEQTAIRERSVEPATPVDAETGEGAGSTRVEGSPRTSDGRDAADTGSNEQPGNESGDGDRAVAQSEVQTPVNDVPRPVERQAVEVVEQQNVANSSLNVRVGEDGSITSSRPDWPFADAQAAQEARRLVKKTKEAGALTYPIRRMPDPTKLFAPVTTMYTSNIPARPTLDVTFSNATGGRVTVELEHHRGKGRTPGAWVLKRGAEAFAPAISVDSKYVLTLKPHLLPDEFKPMASGDGAMVELMLRTNSKLDIADAQFPLSPDEWAIKPTVEEVKRAKVANDVAQATRQNAADDATSRVVKAPEGPDQNPDDAKTVQALAKTLRDGAETPTETPAEEAPKATAAPAVKVRRRNDAASTEAPAVVVRKGRKVSPEVMAEAVASTATRVDSRRSSYDADDTPGDRTVAAMLRATEDKDLDDTIAHIERRNSLRRADINRSERVMKESTYYDLAPEDLNYLIDNNLIVTKDDNLRLVHSVEDGKTVYRIVDKGADMEEVKALVKDPTEENIDRLDEITVEVDPKDEAFVISLPRNSKYDMQNNEIPFSAAQQLKLNSESYRKFLERRNAAKEILDINTFYVNEIPATVQAVLGMADTRTMRRDLLNAGVKNIERYTVPNTGNLDYARITNAITSSLIRYAINRHASGDRWRWEMSSSDQGFALYAQRNGVPVPQLSTEQAALLDAYLKDVTIPKRQKTLANAFDTVMTTSAEDRERILSNAQMEACNYAAAHPVKMAEDEERIEQANAQAYDEGQE